MLSFICVFSILASATGVLCHQVTFTVLSLLCLFVALGVVVTGFVLLFQRVCAHLLLKKIHLARLFPGEYCFASRATELGCLGFQDAGMAFGTWQFLVVTDDSGTRPDRCS